MKRLKKFLNILLVIAVLVVNMPIAKAAGSATVSLNGSATATLGQNYTVTIHLSNITGAGEGVAGTGGKVIFDKEYLEFVSADSKIKFGVEYFPTSSKYSGMTLSSSNYVKDSSTDVVSLVFKPKKLGKTTIRLEDVEVSGDRVLNTNNPSKEITINEPVPKSTNANLSSLGVSSYDLTPTFDKNTTEYRVSVPYSVSRITITATPEDSKAKVSGTGGANLNADADNPFTVTCTAEDGVTKKQYKLIIHREKAPDVPKSTDNTLKSLSVSGYNISPSFNKDTLEYNLTVPNGADSISVKAEANDVKAKVDIIGADNLQIGDNEVKVKVTAEDGSIKVYTINVKKEDKAEEKPELDGDATLSKLYIGGYTLSPTFNKNTNVYSISVGEAVGGLNVDATPTSSKAKVEVKGNNGWKYGMNTVTIVVTAENGNKNTYIINVNRKDPSGKQDNKSNDSYLNSLVVNGATISPNFDKDVSSYTVTVPYDVEKLDISYVTSNNKAKVEIIGNDELQVGTNNVQVKVTAEDGSVRIYMINATRAAFSAKNNLKILSANGFTLNPSFDKDRLEYNLKVKSNTDSLDLTAIAENENAKVEITGNGNFKTGNNVVLIKVTDENGFTKYYQINVDKPEAAVMGMSLGQFLMFLLLGLGLLGVLILLIVLLKRRKDREDKKQVVMQPTPPTPVIDFKPEFNFGSRNGTDDDVVYPGGVLNQGNGQIPNTEPPKKLMEADYEDLTDEDLEEVTRNFDFFDQTITKDELIAAIREGMETHNTDKLRMLLKQDELNQLKKEIKRKEMAKKQNRSDKYDRF